MDLARGRIDANDGRRKHTFKSLISSSYLARRITSSYSRCAFWAKRAKDSSLPLWCSASEIHLSAADVQRVMRFMTSSISVARKKNLYLSLALPLMKCFEFS